MTANDTSLYFPRGRTGILLLHGLGGTPVEMRPLARGFHRAGYTVRCPQLAGHCGSESDLAATRWQDWAASAEEALTALAQECDTVIVGGLSMGAVLAMHLAAQNPDKVHGLALYAPTLWYDGWSIPWYSFLLKLLINTPMGRRFRFVEKPPYGIKDNRIRARVERAMHSGDSTEAGLLGTPSAALKQLWGLVGAVRKAMPGICQPTLLVHARQDDIAALSNAIHIQRHLGGLVQTLVLDDSYHLVTIDKQNDIVRERSINFAGWLETRRSLTERTRSMESAA